MNNNTNEHPTHAMIMADIEKDINPALIMPQNTPKFN